VETEMNGVLVKQKLAENFFIFILFWQTADWIELGSV
jgi:hypothetical protein